ncbi:hypothetical protein [Streptomyces sp. 8N616]
MTETVARADWAAWQARPAAERFKIFGNPAARRSSGSSEPTPVRPHHAC